MTAKTKTVKKVGGKPRAGKKVRLIGFGLTGEVVGIEGENVGVIWNSSFGRKFYAQVGIKLVEVI